MCAQTQMQTDADTNVIKRDVDMSQHGQSYDTYIASCGLSSIKHPLASPKGDGADRQHTAGPNSSCTHHHPAWDTQQCPSLNFHPGSPIGACSRGHSCHHPAPARHRASAGPAAGCVGQHTAHLPCARRDCGCRGPDVVVSRTGCCVGWCIGQAGHNPQGMQHPVVFVDDVVSPCTSSDRVQLVYTKLKSCLLIFLACVVNIPLLKAGGRCV